MLDVRWGDVDFLGGKLKLVVDRFLQQGGNFNIDYADGTTGQGHVKNSGGVGGGFVQQWDLPPSWGKLSFVQLAVLYGWGLVDFDPTDVNLGQLNNAYLSALAADGITLSPDGTNRWSLQERRSLQQSASTGGRTSTGYGIRRITSPWALGRRYQFDDQGFDSYPGQHDNGSISSASADSHLFTAGIRPVLWLWGPFAIQGSFGYRLSLEQSECQGQRLATEVRWASSRLRRPSSPEGASSPVLSYAPLRPSQCGPMTSRARLEVQPTPTRTTDLSLVSKLRHGSKRGNAICPI